ncbi:VC2046/SO_2500 family protein [Aeromonas intestinalis]
MLPNAIRDRLLVDEAQLGQRLNQDLRQGDRADFRLHLALLTDAVDEQPWFEGRSPATTETREWRQHLGLPAQTALQGSVEEGDASGINEHLQQGGCALDLQLWLALRSPPIVAKTPVLAPAVYDNLSALGRERWQARQVSDAVVSAPRGEDPLLMLPLLDRLKGGVEAGLHWLS